MKMDVMFSAETSLDFQRTTKRYIPQDSNTILCSFFMMPMLSPNRFMSAA
jgi:hypothetical protein